MSPDSRSYERSASTSTTQHYTMKTPVTKPPLTSSHSHHHPHHHNHHHPRHSQINSQAFRANRATTTPTASPRMAHSVGQAYPPAAKLSPAIIASHSRSPSPNYFGLSVERSVDSGDTNALPNENWSPPSSSVKSFAAAIPAQVPLDANPEFEEFRRQADANRNQGFNLSGTHFVPVQPLSPAFIRPKAPRRPTGNSDSASEISITRIPTGKLRDVHSRMDVDADSLHDSAYVSSDSKRNSEASLNPPAFTNTPRFESPGQFESPFETTRRPTLSKVDDRHPRLSLPLAKLEQFSEATKPRAETLPTTLEGGSGLMLPSQLKDILENSPTSEYLILDVRVSTQYAQSRVRDALNLCIPTTLLKRATFDLQKLLKTLQTEEDQEKFAQWRKVKYLIVYDASSTEKRDAVSAMNMLKKFANEGFSASSFLLKGGFQTFASSYPALVDRRSASERAGTSVNSSGDGRPLFAPVIGGVALPQAANNPNPFFNNIRQNMDLADGVGQMDINVPSNVDFDALPTWLRETTRASDHGKIVSDSFLQIERNEQSRMKDAYAAFTPGGAADKNRCGVRLSGVEKGVKNRYKDILPFEHARVRLADRSEGSCDYINASHVQASRSNKRYIASQGPLPATFEDFWSVIWDQDVRVIVMLTAESEGGQLKCHPYWQSKEFGPIRLKPLSEKKVSLDIDKPRKNSASGSNAAEAGRRRAMTTNVIDSSNPNLPPAPSQPAETPHVVIRKFALSHAAHPFAPMREITHLHYPSWPDFGTPAQPSHLLALVELANVMQRSALPVDANMIAASAISERPAASNWYDEPESNSEARPMLVHCSAGCGRTGTFCTVDSVIDMLKRQRQALATADRQHDTEGDVQMEDAHSQGNNRSQGAHDQKTSGNVSGCKHEIDESFVRDTSADLIAATVEDFRKQRLSMVQSLRQFVLCYETVLEWIWRSMDKSNGLSTARSRARSGSLESRR
ncbi:phosphotyrosine-specific ptp2-like protein [Diatrype stigma]|uniref:protein-tyrosine-phosphatase n=1 Tax=Diatrype stigma TaxID=117547 RepID=A0AAN9UYX6_9PEZI